MLDSSSRHLRQNFPVILTGNEYREQLGTSVASVATPESLYRHRRNQHRTPLTNASGAIEEPLPTTIAEQE